MENNIKKLRLKKGLTQSKLAKIIGVSRSALSMYEINASEPDFNTVCKFADYFNVTADFILGRNCQNDNTALTDEETLLLANYRKCNKENKKMLIGLSKELLND